MDTKGLAKSKRAHSLQNSRRNNPKPKHAQTQNNPNKRPLLPSNWDRYSFENESSSEQNHESLANQNPGVVLPKSRGADYRHLIAEAQSQPNICVDDVVPDEFSQGVSSMLSVRGDGILAWLGDDNFIIDHKTTSNPQPSFLSLNLHVLAEQLDKIDLCERLFIQPDLLPPDLHSEESKVQPSDCSMEIEIEDRTANIAPDELEAQLDTLLGELDISTEFQHPTAAKIDMWGPLNNVNLDYELDDLLKQTAIVTSQSNIEPSLGESSSSNPKLLNNDFDSWLDSL